MLISLLVLWVVSMLIGKWRPIGSRFFATLVAIPLALLAAILQGFMAATANEAAGINTDGMVYLNGLFLTFVIGALLAYREIRAAPPKEKQAKNEG
ncbi:MAG: hypothetical protein Q8L60_10815 [Gammaproteobacteria bacterium]|nr:hypothetical protein [Gammaproteobacteria bacterium]MDP2346839.1 hypothetical protein [Gammaproteobacteria bacterium]